MTTVDPDASLTSPTPVTAQNSATVIKPAIIEASASLSEAVDLGLSRLSRISMPASWTTAKLTFQVSPDGDTYQDLYDYLGIETTVEAAAAREISLDIQPFLSIRYIKVRSGISATAVAQAARREIKLICLK